ncbi:DUF6723 family protein [Caballeronia concitans]|jgi:hypothetical protein|uniref:Uncharacterized protein n=1 Tax=Caballeronia concitans TaxID=1777133 RepID=A0A658R5I5_9BURK|nr:DUF6723 family protein [Caballeronia concitans]SAL52691.1 hypothetical protein AWB72_05628 [Caballeronia concitans]
MNRGSGKRPKLVFFPARFIPPTPGLNKNDYEIYATYYGSIASGFFGKLKVIRKTDGKLLFPYDGADTIGPFETIEVAVRAAKARGEEVVNGDLNFPEL